MQVEVLFFGKFRALSGCTRQYFALDEPACLGSLVEVLAKEHKRPFRRAMVDARILVNGRESGLVGGEAAPLGEGDTVAFLTPIGGG